jgi:succinate dehydrogenase / fumarate reductase, cytochrome b subunit
MLARVHALLGIVPLGTYLVFHMLQTWPALDDREQWVERALSGPARGVVVLWVFVPVALHAVLGFARMRRETTHPRSGSPGLRWLQAITGALALGFLVYHVAQVWAVSAGPHGSPRDAYAALWRSLGRPLDAVVYVLGVTALSFHVAHGLVRALVTFGAARSALAVSRLRLAAGVLGFALWVSLLQLLGHFAVGEPLIRFGS